MNNNEHEIVDVLVVDDDENLRSTLTDLLLEWGFRVRASNNGLEALRLIADGLEPRLVLLDLDMPIMDGWTFLAERRTRERLASIPVVLLTGESTFPRTATDVLDLLQKPPRTERLLELVRRISTRQVA